MSERIPRKMKKRAKKRIMQTTWFHRMVAQGWEPGISLRLENNTLSISVTLYADHLWT